MIKKFQTKTSKFLPPKFPVPLWQRQQVGLTRIKILENKTRVSSVHIPQCKYTTPDRGYCRFFSRRPYLKSQTCRLKNTSSGSMSSGTQWWVGMVLPKMGGTRRAAALSCTPSLWRFTKARNLSTKHDTGRVRWQRQTIKKIHVVKKKKKKKSYRQYCANVRTQHLSSIQATLFTSW